MKLISSPHILKIDITDLHKLYFTSDLHLNHKSIIEYCNRPFVSIEKMNETIISNMQSVLSHDSILVNCGDFILGKCSMYQEFIDAIPSYKIYNCIGNHDIKNIFRKAILEPYNEDARVYWGYSILIQVYDKNKQLFGFTCSHCPMADNNFLGIFNIHGHLHTIPELSKYIGRDYELSVKLLNNGLYYDCGVDNNNFKPISFIDIIKHRPKIYDKILEIYPNFADKCEIH